MMSGKKQVIEKVLKDLYFVNWDRYFGDEKCLTFFGWINREDKYKDFVVLDFYGKEISFATSSKKFSSEIADILHQEHSECKRVEYFTSIENVIKETSKPESKSEGKK